VSDDRHEILSRIETAAAEVARASARLRELVAQAVAGQSATVAEIAQAADVTRQTVYRWSAHVTLDGRMYGNAGAAMNEALYALIEAGAGPSHELVAGLRTGDRTAKARRVLLGAKNVPSTVSEEQRSVIGVGCVAAHNTLRVSGGAAT
jgi:hypothetical protein